MNLLQVFFAISGVVIFVIALDISKRQKFNALHFLVFLGIGGGLLLFAYIPQALDLIGRIFGIPRGADVLVYGGIVFLSYFSLLLLNKVERNREDLTKLIRELAIESSSKRELSWKFAFVIAAYNEEKVIGSTIQNLLDAGYGNLVITNDGSRDATFSVAHAFEAKNPGVVVLRHAKNRGQGAALETGFEYLRRYGSNVEYVVTYDADGQHDLADLLSFSKVLDAEKDVEIVLGSRFLGETKSNVPFGRRIVLKLWILFTYVISQIHLTDTHNGYRVFRYGTLDRLSITLDGMGHASEILDIIAEKKLRYREVPVTIRYDEYSLAKGQRSSNAINIALKMIWKKFFS